MVIIDLSTFYLQTAKLADLGRLTWKRPWNLPGKAIPWSLPDKLQCGFISLWPMSFMGGLSRLMKNQCN